MFKKRKIILFILSILILLLIGCSDNDNGNISNGDQNDYTYATIDTFIAEGKGEIELSPNKKEYNYGDLVRIKAIADDGYKFEWWDGSILGNVNPQYIVVDSNLVIGARFVEEITEINWVSYSNNLFSVMYPEDWSYSVYIEDRMIFFRDEESAWFTIGYFNIDSELTRDEIIQFGIKRAEDTDKEVGSTVITQREITINNRPAYKYISEEYKYGEEDIKKINIVTNKGNVFFSVSFDDKISSFKETQNLANRMIASFEFLY